MKRIPPGRDGAIFVLAGAGVTTRELASKYGLSRSRIKNIVWHQRRVRRLLDGFRLDPSTGLYVRDAA